MTLNNQVSVTRASINCQRCQGAHSSCDRTQPSCHRCTRLGFECSYNIPRKRGRKPSSDRKAPDFCHIANKRKLQQAAQEFDNAQFSPVSDRTRLAKRPRPFDAPQYMTSDGSLRTAHYMAVAPCKLEPSDSWESLHVPQTPCTTPAVDQFDMDALFPLTAADQRGHMEPVIFASETSIDSAEWALMMLDGPSDATGQLESSLDSCLDSLDDSLRFLSHDTPFGSSMTSLNGSSMSSLNGSSMSSSLNGSAINASGGSWKPNDSGYSIFAESAFDACQFVNEVFASMAPTLTPPVFSAGTDFSLFNEASLLACDV
jgi:hypothetical protein